MTFQKISIMSDLDLRKLANQSSQPISTTSFCPILTMLQSKPKGYNPLDHELRGIIGRRSF